MKKAKTVLDFDNDSVNILGKRIKLIVTESGPYSILITKTLSGYGEISQVLFLKDIHKKSYEEKLKITTKLHLQFSHANDNKLYTLAKNSGTKDSQF